MSVRREEVRALRTGTTPRAGPARSRRRSTAAAAPAAPPACRAATSARRGYAGKASEAHGRSSAERRRALVNRATLRASPPCGLPSLSHARPRWPVGRPRRRTIGLGPAPAHETRCARCQDATDLRRCIALRARPLVPANVLGSPAYLPRIFAPLLPGVRARMALACEGRGAIPLRSDRLPPAMQRAVAA